MYISTKGVYAGTFSNGVACGRGKFIGEKVRYEGEWKDGRIVEGSLETKQFKFRGKFEETYPCKGMFVIK